MAYNIEDEKNRIISIMNRAGIPSAVVDTLSLTAEQIAFMKFQLYQCEKALVDDPNNAEMIRAYTNLAKVNLSYINQILTAVPDDLKDEVITGKDDVLQLVRDMHKSNGRSKK